MNHLPTQLPHLESLAEGLSQEHQAEFYRILHESGVGSKDVELARLLRALQLYKAYYEQIPAAVQATAAEIDRLKEEIAEISRQARLASETGCEMADKVVNEAERVRDDLTGIHHHVEEAIRQSAEHLASRMADLLTAGIDQTVLVPIQNRLVELASSNQAFDDAVEGCNRAAAALRKGARLARRMHLGAYALAAVVIAGAMTLGSWSILHSTYTERIERERLAFIQQTEKHRELLLELARSNRTLKLVRDPKRPNKAYLVMKNASGWQTTSYDGVIEFKD